MISSKVKNNNNNNNNNNKKILVNREKIDSVDNGYFLFIYLFIYLHLLHKINITERKWKKYIYYY